MNTILSSRSAADCIYERDGRFYNKMKISAVEFKCDPDYNPDKSIYGYTGVMGEDGKLEWLPKIGASSNRNRVVLSTSPTAEHIMPNTDITPLVPVDVVSEWVFYFPR